MWHDLVKVDSEALLYACSPPEEVKGLQPVQLLYASQCALCQCCWAVLEQTWNS